MTPSTVSTGAPAAISINPTALPAAVFGEAYSATLSATGGAAPYSFSIAYGALPGGLSMAAGGLITGTPTLADPTVAETYDVAIQAHDANGVLGVQEYSGTVAAFVPAPAPVSGTPTPTPMPAPVPVLTITPSSIGVPAGSPTMTAVSISGGVAPYALVDAPDGVTFDGANLEFDAGATTSSGFPAEVTLVFEDSSTPPVEGSVVVTLQAPPVAVNAIA